jgi:hypothetical protein
MATKSGNTLKTILEKQKYAMPNKARKTTLN